VCAKDLASVLRQAKRAAGPAIRASAPWSGWVELALLSEREAITMQMQQVRYFLALCEELNFTRAARRCGVS